MQTQAVSVQAASTLRDFVSSLSPDSQHEAYPVFEGSRVLGTVHIAAIARVPPEKWATTPVRDLVDGRAVTVREDSDAMHALSLLLGEHRQPILIVLSEQGDLRGILTKTDILQALKSTESGAGDPAAATIAAT